MTYRLLKVVCQAVLVTEDDDGNLVEHQTQPVNVAAGDWPAFPGVLAARLAELNNGKDTRD